MRAPLVVALLFLAGVITAGQQTPSGPPILLPKPSHPLAPRARVLTVTANSTMNVRAVAGDVFGNVFVVGQSSATEIPGLARGFQQKPIGIDVFVIKLNARGEVLWSTYLGGTDRGFGGFEFAPFYTDSPTSIAVDAAGNVYVAGSTAALNFPLVNPFNASNAASFDGPEGFITKISADGQRLLYSSFLGIGAAAGLAVGPAGEVWVASATSLIKLNPAGNPIWTRRHGSGMFSAVALAVDSFGRPYIAAQQCGDGLVNRPCRTIVQQFDTSGTAIGYETALEPGQAAALAVTPEGRAVLAGLSCPTILPSRRLPGVAIPDCGVGDRPGWVVTLGTTGEVESVMYAEGGIRPKAASDTEGRVVVLSTQAPAGLPTVRALVDHHVDGPIYISPDRGATWRAMAGARVDMTRQVLDFDYDATRKSVYATVDDDRGLYESFDEGRTWQHDRRPRKLRSPSNVVLNRLSNLAIDRRDPSTRYATSAGSILRHDGFTDWETALPGVPNTQNAWFPVETNPFDGTVWTATRGALAISADSGRTWTRRPLQTAPGTLFPSSIVFHPTRAGTVYAGSNDLWASYDNGESWQSLTSAIQPRPAITSIAIDSMNNFLYAGSVSRLGVLRTTDEGQTWSATLVGHAINAVAVDPSHPNLVYAGGRDPENRPVVYRSIDRGETWQRVMNGLDIRSEVTQMLLDPRDPSRIYVGARLGEVPFLARLVPSGVLPGRVRVPSQEPRRSHEVTSPPTSRMETAGPLRLHRSDRSLSASTYQQQAARSAVRPSALWSSKIFADLRRLHGRDDQLNELLRRHRFDIRFRLCEVVAADDVAQMPCAQRAQFLTQQIFAFRGHGERIEYRACDVGRTTVFDHG